MFKTTLNGLLIACAFLLALPAHSATMHYSLTDAKSTHGIWLKPIKEYLGVKDHTFALGDNHGSFVFDDVSGKAKLSATGTNNGGKQVEIRLELTSRGVGKYGQGTAGPQHQSGTLETSVTDSWTYFDLDVGKLILTGFKDHEDGTEIDITTFPNPEDRKPAQFGFGGNWLDHDLGFSLWYDCSSVKTGHCGDVNLDVVPSNPVPEPSAALLFGIGFTVAGSLTRRGRED